MITTHEEVAKMGKPIKLLKASVRFPIMMKPETKLWHELKRITPEISWTRIENTSLFGTPDLLGYNVNSHFFTVELKITS